MARIVTPQAPSILARRYFVRNYGETVVSNRLIDCVPFTKWLSVTADLSGAVDASGFVVSGGLEVELDDASGNSFGCNHVEVTFFPVSSNIADTSLDISGYSFVGYGWVHPWGSNLQGNSTFRGIHVGNTINTGRGAYGAIAALGYPAVLDVETNSSLTKVRLFNNFGGDVYAFINYSLRKESNDTQDRAGDCGD